MVRYLMRIGGMIIGVVVGSAVLASALVRFLGRFAVVADVGTDGLFVGLATMGLMTAVLTREAWLRA